MKNLGNILIFLLVPQIIFASVTARVNYPVVELGDMVTFSLDISGDNISRPKIQRICGSDVISTSSQTSMQVVNGDFRKSYILSYKFLPQKTCKINAIDIDIDGKIEKSNEVTVTVKAVSASKDKTFALELVTDKKSVLVGETFDVTLLFKQKANSKAVDSKFVPPELKGFWIKNESKPTRYQDGLYSVTKVVYTLAAQRVGKLKVSKAQMRIASRSSSRDFYGSFMPNIKWKTYFSNELDIEVKALPNGVNLVGEFRISMDVDKTQVNANEAVNITINVLGKGNLEDIASFKPFIDEVSVFDEKIAINGTSLTQKIAFVSERDFTIPSFELKYFDTTTNKIKTISTKEINIKVKNAKIKEELEIKRDESNTKEVAEVVNVQSSGFDTLTLVLVFIIGLIVGVLIMLIKPFKASKKEPKISLKDPKLLLMKLLPYKDDEAVQNILDILENNLYANQKLEIDKKALKEIFKKYDI